MDFATAFSVATSAAQFVDLSAKVFLCLFEYFRNLKQAPKRSNELQQEAFLLSIVLRDLKSTLEATDSPDPLSKEILNNVVAEFAKVMIDMEKRVEVKGGDWKNCVKWPFTEKENEKYLLKLERYKTTFHLVLSIIQGYYLLL